MNTPRRATGKWALQGVPHKGWTCIEVEDLEEVAATCEMCEAQEIRYVHLMSHPNYPDELRCGCDCAGHMEEDYEGAIRRDKAMRGAAGRKKKWLTRSWRVSEKGNSFLRTDGYHVVVYRRGGSWAFRVTNRTTDDVLESRKYLPSEDAAKLRAFDAMIWMKERGR